MIYKQVNIDEFISSNYLNYGKFINFNRVIPRIDGLKSVHRRVLLALANIAKGKLVGTVNAIGESQKLHPFGDKSIEGVIADLARLNVINSQGEFGAKLLENIQCAAPRYTKVGLSNEQYNYYFNLMKYAPTHEGEEAIEPKFLITPIPHALIYGGLNWGLGIISRTPAFTYNSLVNAYYANDPTLLESNYGYVMDKSSPGLQKLWDEGVGALTLEYKVNRINDDTILIHGSGEIFTPGLAAFNEYTKRGALLISNESDSNVIIRISRVSRMSVDMNEVFEIAKRICSKRRNYEIKVVHDDKIITLGVKDWIHVTISLFKKYFEESKIDRIKDTEFKIEVLKMMPRVAKLILEEKSDEEILKLIPECNPDTLAAIQRKSISSLRRKDFESEINSLTNLIQAIKKEDADSTIKSFGK